MYVYVCLSVLPFPQTLIQPPSSQCQAFWQQVRPSFPSSSSTVITVAPDSVITCGNIKVTRIRRGGYVFVTWEGDHPPRHVHVYGEDGLILKWDLERGRALEGVAPRRIVKLIEELVRSCRL